MHFCKNIKKKKYLKMIMKNLMNLSKNSNLMFLYLCKKLEKKKLFEIINSYIKYILFIFNIER